MQKVCTNFPKFYICKYGAFYEGQRLAQYCWSSGDNYYYLQTVILEKLFVHYDNNYSPCIYFRVRQTHNKKSWSLPCEGYLGISYRKL